MENTKQTDCSCEKATCDCARTKTERCTCGEQCNCGATCRCGAGCGCKAAR